MPFIDRNSIALISANQRSGGRASLHTGAPPTDENRITEAGYATEAGSGVAVGGWFGEGDSSAGIGFGTTPAFVQYAECDFRTPAGLNPVVPDGTRIRSIRFQWPLGAIGGGEGVWTTLCWAHLDLDFPAPNDAARVFFREPGSLPADSSQFIAPSIVINRPPYDGRGGAAVDYSRARLTFRGEDWWAKWFRNHNVIRTFNETRARAAIGNATLVLSDTPGGPAPSAEWPRVGGIGIASKRFIHGGAEETSLDLVNVREIVVPAAAVDRTIPEFWCIWGRGGVERPRVPEELRGVPWFYGAMMACSTGSRILGAGDELVIPAEALCCSMYGRWSDATFIPPEPGQVTGLRANTRDVESTILTWDAVRGAHGYLLQVADEPTFASPIHECVELGRSAALSRYPEQTWYARVGATNAAGRGEWSDVLEFVPGALGPPPTDLVVEVAETSLTWKWQVPSEEIERCEVEWTGHPDGDGTAEVTVSPGGEWSYPITGLPAPVDGVGTRVGLRVRTIIPDLSPWEPLDDYVWGETAAPNQIPAPENLRETFVGATEVRYAWDRPEGFDWSRIRLRWTRATGGTAGPIDGYLVRKAGVVVVGGALAGSSVTVDVQAGEAAEGPWSAAVSLTTMLFDPARRPDDPTNMQAVAEIGAVRLSCDLPPGVRFARFQWEEYYPGQTEGVTHSRVVEGDTLLVPGFAGTRIVARAWSSADRRGTVLSANPTEDAEATISEEIPVPFGFTIEPRPGGGLLRWGIEPGIVRSAIDYQIRAESFSTNPAARILSGGRLSVAAPGASRFIPAALGHWIRGRVRAEAPNGAHSSYTLWDEAQVPHQNLPPQNWMVAPDENGDIRATFTAPDDPLPVVEIEVVRETPTGNVVSERRLNVRDGSLSVIVDTHQALDKTVRARARYASGVRPSGAAFAPFSPWTDYESATVILAAPSVSCVATADTATYTIGVVIGAHHYEFRRKGSELWHPAPANREVVIPDLEAETAYIYEFRGLNAGGVGPVTEEECTTLAGTEPVPAVPSMTAGASTTSSVSFTIGEVSGASRYEWSRTSAADGTWTADNDRVVTITGLSANTPITVYGRACNASGCSVASAALNLRTSQAPGPGVSPPAATSCAFTETSNSITGTVAATARAHAASNGGYQYRYSGGGISLTAWTNTNSNRQFTITGLRPATAYTVRWRAVGPGGDGPERNEVVTTDEAPSIPSPSLAIYARTSTSLTVQLGAVTGNPTGYAARAGRSGSYTASSGTATAAARRVRLTGLASGTAHLIQGIARRGSTFSDPTEGTWKTLPARPTARETIGRTSIAAVISAVTGADRYRWRAGATAATLGGWNNIPSGGRSFSISSLAPGTTRVVEVAAGHDEGWSSARRYTWRTTAALGVPRITALSAAATLVDLVLSAVSGATFYDYSLNGGGLDIERRADPADHGPRGGHEPYRRGSGADGYGSIGKQLALLLDPAGAAIALRIRGERDQHPGADRIGHRSNELPAATSEGLGGL